MAEQTPRLGFTAPGQPRIALNTDAVQMMDLTGAGIPAQRSQTVSTPGRDGETWLRSMLEPRFLIAQLQLVGDGLTQTQALRRQVIRALNPKRGIGVIDWTPVAGGTTYEIDGVFERGLGFDDQGDDHREFVEYAAVSFRCPDPAWREQTLNAIPIGASGGGLSIPLAMPLTLAEAGTTQTIDNSGDLDAYPVITATGTFDGLMVRNETTGKKVWFPSLSVSAGQTIVIDMDRRTATLDGTNVMPYRSPDSEAWPLVLGENTITASVSSGSVDLIVTYPTLLIGV